MIEFSNATGLDIFPNLKTLILDHNNFSSLISFPRLEKLETLSISYNAIRNLE
jgi:Leucine-rich repeat (LRR) protein